MFDILGKESNFEKYAEVAANQYLNDNVPLNDAIVKIATEKELNPEQIKRVVEAANVKVFQKHFSDSDREGHKDVDFDVADPKVIIKKIYIVKGSPSCPMHKEKKDMSPGFGMGKALDFFRNLGTDGMFASKKEDAFEDMDLPSEDIIGDSPTIIIRIRKAKANLEKKAFILTEEYTELLTEVAKPFTSTGDHQPEFNEFCKTAYEHLAENADDQLEAIALRAKLIVAPRENFNLSKVAGFITKEVEGIDLVQNTAQDFAVQNAISDSFGFGGHNSVLVLQKYAGK